MKAVLGVLGIAAMLTLGFAACAHFFLGWMFYWVWLGFWPGFALWFVPIVLVLAACIRADAGPATGEDGGER